VPDHVVHRHGQGGFVSKHGHAQAVTDQDHFDPCLLLQIGGGIVIACEPRDGFAFRDLFEQIGQRDFLAHFRHVFSFTDWMYPE
jgi:hypothetical protein